jgi:hypothetical protein
MLVFWGLVFYFETEGYRKSMMQFAVGSAVGFSTVCFVFHLLGMGIYEADLRILSIWEFTNGLGAFIIGSISILTWMTNSEDD